LRETLARHPERFDRIEIMTDVMGGMETVAAHMIRLLGWDARAHPAHGHQLA
jgi:hypothetical protein